MPVGVTAQAVEVPASTTSTYSTQNGFMLTLADWGPVGSAIPTTNVQNAAAALGTPSGSSSIYGPRTTTSAVAIDSANTFFEEDGQANPILYVSRVVGPSAAAASLVLQDSSSNTSITITAQYVGAGGNGIYVAVVNSGSSYMLGLYDSLGNTLTVSGSFTTVVAGVAWLNATGYVTAVAGTGAIPKTLTATALSGGTDNRAGITLTQIAAALAAFPKSLGPGQVFAPNWTNTTLAGIWSALANHGLNFNRVAICDMDDNQAAATEITDLGSFGTSAVGTYAGFWAGSRQIPGVVVNTTRVVPPSPVLAALCAQADAVGTPNTAPAGINFELEYATQPSSIVSGAPYDTYSMADLNTLNAAGINTFQQVNSMPCNYGFATPVLTSTDGIYWQFTHSRLRMYIIAQAQIIGQALMFSQLDSSGVDQAAYQSALQGQLLDPLVKAGALYGGYQVDVGSDINTPATISAGQLNAKITCSFSYFVQNVTLLVNVQPITSTTA